MNDILLFEHLSGGGLPDAHPLECSLLLEGRAMADALAADFSAVEGVQAVVPRDRRLLRPAGWPPNVRVIDVADFLTARAAFCALAAECKATVVIAPEFNGILLDWVLRAEQAGATLLSPDSNFVRLTADKHATCERLQAAGVAVPTGWPIAQGEPLPAAASFPAVLKPRDGAGSQGVLMLHQHPGATFVVDRPSRLEKFMPGTAASIAVLFGCNGNRAILPACRQHLSSDGRFSYLGGSLPLPPPLDARARALVAHASDALPPTTGYVGFDLVLGQADDGSDDAVIEVNPRLTTSYVGLRAACRQNLAGAMLDLAAGRMPRLSFASNLLEFDAAGNTNPKRQRGP